MQIVVIIGLCSHSSLVYFMLNYVLCLVISFGIIWFYKAPNKLCELISDDRDAMNTIDKILS